jgi:hypothetical protein
LAFWEDWREMTDEEDAEFRFVDYGERERLRGEVIREVRASPVGKYGFAKLAIELASGRRIALFFVDNEDVNSEVRMSITPKGTVEDRG